MSIADRPEKHAASARAPADSDASLGVVRRCVCYDLSFRELRDMAEREGCGIGGLHKKTGIGARCGLCIPYIRLMLLTGKTDLPVLWSDQFRERGVPPDPLRRMERYLGVDGRGKRDR